LKDISVEQTGAFDVAAWTTHGDRTRLLERRPGFLGASVTRQERTTIEVENSSRYQTMDGFGFALTGGSAELIHGLPPEPRRALLEELFSRTASGAGISCLRLSIGASDLGRESFSYDDCGPGEEDPQLKRFDLGAGDVHVVPLLKEILAINPAMRLLASPWSAPSWMKTNGSFIAGSLKRKYYRAYANYLVLYLLKMKSLGISVAAITPQNEPLNGENEPSMRMGAKAQAEFIGSHLGPALAAAGLSDVDVFCYDHNCDRPDYPLTVLSDPRARSFTAGVAWHLYRGAVDAMSQVGKLHPNMKVYLTEQWVGADGQFAGDLVWHVGNVLIGAIRNGAQAILEWNLAGDPAHGPHTPGGADKCVGALTIDGATIVARNVSYYVIAHLARFVPPGSERIASSETDALPNVAFETPDGRIVLLVLNDGSDAKPFDIAWNARAVADELPAGAVATYVWKARETTPAV
jgi:glucosylceramidase